MKTLYKVGKYLVSEDLSIIYVYDNWCKTPAAAKFRKLGFSGSSGSFGGDNICLGIDPQGNEIMSDGVWYVYEGGITPEEKDLIISQIKKQKDEK